MRKFAVRNSNETVSIVTVLDSKTNAEIIAQNPAFSGNLGYRDIVEEDIPDIHIDIRDAWEDSQEGDQIDVSHQKAKDILLEQLRAARDTELTRLDGLKLMAEETSDSALLASVLADRQALRDCTEDLKAMSGSGYNNEYTLDEMRAKAQLPVISN